MPVSNFAPPDVCALAVAKPNWNDIDRCAALDTDHPQWCARVTVAVTARGRAYLDRRARSIELVRTSELVRYLSPDWARTPLKPLQDALGGSVVGLPDADGLTRSPARSASTATPPTTPSPSCSPTAPAASCAGRAT